MSDLRIAGRFAGVAMLVLAMAGCVAVRIDAADPHATLWAITVREQHRVYRASSVLARVRRRKRSGWRDKRTRLRAAHIQAES